MSELSYMEMIRAAREGKEYLSFIDLPTGARIRVTIKRVFRKTNVKGIGGRVHKVVDFLEFENKEKALWLSLGKLKTLSKILGENIKDWVGKEIVLFADPTVTMKGEPVGGLVIEKG